MMWTPHIWTILLSANAGFRPGNGTSEARVALLLEIAQIPQLQN
jgi:hypothetical protein